MKDFLFISHRFQKEDIPRIESILEDNDLLDIVDFEKEGILSGLCSARLPINDKRISVFINLTGKIKEKPFVRFDREFSKSELDKCEYLAASIATAGLENPISSQSYDFKNACKECGAGVIPNEPLIIPTNSMGKKLLDKTAHNEWLVFKNILAEKIKHCELSGISFHTIKIGRNETDYYWGKINNILPRLHPESKFRKNLSPCKICSKSGNFGNFETETRFFYDKDSLKYFNDFNLTFEFFGEWKYSKLGGAQLLIINQKVRQLMINEKVRFLNYVPIEIVT